MTVSHKEPTWNDVLCFFKTPYWYSEEDSKKFGENWRNVMIPYGIDLWEYDSVIPWADTIYYHIASGNMPKHYTPFPDEACEAYRVWVNQGLRRCSTDPIKLRENPLPNTRPQSDDTNLGVRKDILAMTQEELDDYRMKIDDILMAGEVFHNNIRTPWQDLGYLHGDWCLHYQEAFLPWHRANLLYVESLIGCRIPYWNWYAAESSNPDSPAAGIPQPFLDDEYVHPVTKLIRKNPLKYACSKDGIPKLYKSIENQQKASQYVTRYEHLTDPSSNQHEYEKCIRMFDLFHKQVDAALKQPLFSVPEGNAMPWANLPAFVPPMPDHDYRDSTTVLSFDNLFEQPHDNFHGVIGHDMADNAFTAFDPIFYSLHVNIDRIFEKYINQNPSSLFTSAFCLEPFKGPQASSLAMGDPRKYLYTTIGDMAKCCEALGYRYGQPVFSDYKSNDNKDVENRLLVQFEGVKCTDESFTIDVFLVDDASVTDDNHNFSISDKNYVGRVTRLGMGEGTKNRNRCVKKGVKKFLFIDSELIKSLGRDLKIIQIVKNMKTGAIINEDEYSNWSGFKGELLYIN
ncbi:hypothetical protein AKO1_012450 [Acrasis kona]|uniref:Tyrosinase copper-binding domain-containing protein n=1 Tax=Acrasis kona TaxID=1008807 RepID=A0AAW2YXC5_9EUKA